MVSILIKELDVLARVEIYHWLAKMQYKHSISPLPKIGSNFKNIIMNDGCEIFLEQKNISPHQHFAEISISSNLLP